MSDKGPNDLEEVNNKLTKQVEFLQFKCRQAGAAIVDQGNKIKSLESVIDRLSEEHTNLTTMLKK